MRNESMNRSIFEILSIQEFLAVKNDIRPVMRQGLEKESIDTIKRKVEKEKMCLLLKTLDIPRLVNKNQIFKERNIVAYISKSMELAKQTYRADIESDDKNFGRLLGYPECCVDFYQHKIPHPTGDEFSFVLHTFSNTNDKSSFYTNNIFNFQSRLPTKHKLDIFDSFKEMLEERIRLFLISHIPCSYRCKESIRIGSEILKLLENENQQFAGNVVSFLRKTFLVLDDFNWVSFDGKVNGNSICYRTAKPFLTLYPPDKFIQGNKVIVDSNEIKIFKDGDLLHEIRKPDKNFGILDFS